MFARPRRLVRLEQNPRMGNDRRRPRRAPRVLADLADVAATDRPPLDEPFRHETAVDRGHRVPRDTELSGQLARRGQAVADRESAGEDAVTQLDEQRLGRASLELRIDEEVHSRLT